MLATSIFYINSLVNEAGGIEGLVLLLSDDLASSRLFAAQCITSMSPSGMETPQDV